jgi:deazaflavin-dependent oxidoreductase (nitroreductase family)
MSRWYRTVRPLGNVWTKGFTWMYPRGLWLIAGRSYLLLTTRGRVTGRDRVTPLGYVSWQGKVLVQSLHGVQSDWVLNLRAFPQARLLMGRRRLDCVARFLIDGEEKRAALTAIRSSKTIAGLTARRHRSSLLNASDEDLGDVTEESSRLLVVLEPKLPGTQA